MSKIFLSVSGLLLVSIFLGTSGNVWSQTSRDLTIVKQKIYYLCLHTIAATDSVADQTVDQLVQKMDRNGGWKDIDYKSNTAAKWQPLEHWKRLLKLTLSYKLDTGGFYKSQPIKKAIDRGIQFWLDHTPIAGNGWYNVIGVPNIMGKVYLLLQDELDSSTIAKGIVLLKKGTKADYYDYYGPATGQNLLWLAAAHLYAACIANDVAGVQRVFTSVANEIAINDGEGIQADFSFYQHGPQNYALGYGKGFAEFAVRYLYLANGTAFALPAEKINILSNYILKGLQWMTYGSYLEYTAMGREISRNASDPAPILNALMWMQDIDPANKAAYQAFYERLSGKPSAPKISWQSLLLAVGPYDLVRNGNEYDGVFPVWDWRKLPGLLNRQTQDSFPLFLWGAGSKGAKPFVYGLSDGLFGCFAYDFEKDQVTAHRAWFLFDNEIVCLANSIQGKAVYQSINQTIKMGPIWKSKPVGNNNSMVFHDSIGYVILNNSNKVVLHDGPKTGSWKSINAASSNAPITKDIFDLGIAVEPKPAGSKLAYVLLPAIGLPAFKQYQLARHISIIKNETDVQAVHQKDLEQLQAVFYKKGSIKLPWKNLSIVMKAPGLLMIKKKENRLVIDYSQPDEKKHVEIDLTNNIKFDNADVHVGSVD